MQISSSDLISEYSRAAKAWPWLYSVEREYGLASMTLFAVGSRETNLTNEIGDGGHGNGVWQLDDRSHTIPAGFNNDVKRQADTAAHMLRTLLDNFHGRYDCAFAAYNAGAGTVKYNLSRGINVDTGTAGGNYSSDVISRLHYLQAQEGTSMAQTLTNDDINAIVKAVFGHKLHWWNNKHKNGVTFENAVVWSEHYANISAAYANKMTKK